MHLTDPLQVQRPLLSIAHACCAQSPPMKIDHLLSKSLKCLIMSGYSFPIRPFARKANSNYCYSHNFASSKTTETMRNPDIMAETLTFYAYEQAFIECECL